LSEHKMYITVMTAMSVLMDMIIIVLGLASVWGITTLEPFTFFLLPLLELLL
jgi:hypothetical protein